MFNSLQLNEIDATYVFSCAIALLEENMRDNPDQMKAKFGARLFKAAESFTNDDF